MALTVEQEVPMEDVLVRGSYQGLQRIAGIKCGLLQVDWVYNPMPPKPMQIYPEVTLETIREFYLPGLNAAHRE